ncbi:MAG: integrase arm-type DNA-binding domain-containing protein [Bdellovibrionales bacterium]
MLLSETKCRNAKPKAKPYKLADGNGLYLEVLPNGGRYWRQKYRFFGKEKRLAHGVYPTITLAEARQMALEARKRLAEGHDPAIVKQQRKLDSQIRQENMPRGKCVYNTRLLKATLSYSAQEVAEVYGLHKNVVLRWFKEGLRPLDDGRRPLLVRGDELARFLKARQGARKTKCQPDEFFCFKCRAPRRPFGNMVDIVQESTRLMRVKAVCEVCGTPINKSQALHNLPAIEKTFDVQKRTGFDLSHCTDPRLEVEKEEQDAERQK